VAEIELAAALYPFREPTDIVERTRLTMDA